MDRRQTRLPRQWLIADQRLGARLWKAVRRLPPGSGIIIVDQDRRTDLRRLRRLAAIKGHTIANEADGTAVRVHNLRELRRALQRGTPVLLLSPLYPTRSHPEWRPIPRMRAAALARLGKRRLFALGGMDQRRFREVERLGFIGWAGIDAWASGLRLRT